jgi:hypothetical protein
MSLIVHIFWFLSLKSITSFFPLVGETKKDGKNTKRRKDKNKYTATYEAGGAPAGGVRFRILEPNSYDIAIRIGLPINIRLKRIDL